MWMLINRCKELTEGISTLQQEMSELVEDNATIIRQISLNQRRNIYWKVPDDINKSL